MFRVIVKQGKRFGNQAEFHGFTFTAGKKFSLALPVMAAQHVHHLRKCLAGRVSAADIFGITAESEIFEKDDADKGKFECWFTRVLREGFKHPILQQER